MPYLMAKIHFRPKRSLLIVGIAVKREKIRKKSNCFEVFFRFPFERN